MDYKFGIQKLMMGDVVTTGSSDPTPKGIENYSSR
jgi:hypothetical protein